MDDVWQQAAIHALGDSAVAVTWGNLVDDTVHDAVMSMLAAIDVDDIPGVTECVPAYSSLTVFYNPLKINLEGVCSRLREIMATTPVRQQCAGRVVEIPVCYGGMYGPDLKEVARLHDMTVNEVVSLHTAPLYKVYMLGFTPGFPYLGGLPEALATPRRLNPRNSVPAGSVGIGGTQTGIYPLATPGGWNLIGRTPRCLFRPDEFPPTLLQAGDRVRFIAVPEETCAGEWKEDRP